ncbi:MAG: low molecular weight protein arginine phosphatase [Clostridia bacterium]|nr:low molecular weight protein arginine phosphatase [Clostridia bacterium]MDD4048260.1 low molecular weight protein arginine phosphatase [Clostridia bacterium]
MAEKDKTLILFVCTGNTCRSSMAEALAKDFISRMKNAKTNIKVVSAGTGAIDNEMASPQARAVMQEMGLDISKHRSSYLTKEFVKKAKIVLTMTERQKDYVVKMLPDVEEKVYVLKEFVMGEEMLHKQRELAKKLYEKIEKIKREFFQEHRDEIIELEKSREKTLFELQKIEGELIAWEKKFSEVAKEETKALKRVEDEIKDLDILDPFGQSIEKYRACATQLSEYVSKAVHKILKNYSSGKLQN